MRTTPPAARSALIGLAGLLAMSCDAGGPAYERRADEPATAPAAPGAAFDARVVRVVDGDTLLADRAGRRVRVRLIGIDAPESVKPDAPVECFGPEAGERLAALLPPGTRVRAAFEPGGETDRFGRALWDVWLADGRFVQGELVRAGAAEARPYRPQTRYAAVLDRLEQEAVDEGAGMYGACG